MFASRNPAGRSGSRFNNWLLGALVLGVWGLLLRPYLPSSFADAKASPSEPSVATYDTLTAQRINIVDANGNLRLVIANGARFPDPELRGRVSKRSIDNAAGMVFYDGNGQETGGLGLARLGTQDVANLTFDYTYQETDGIRMIKQESPDGTHWQTGFQIFDRRPYKPGPIESSQGVQRVSLSDENQNAELVISDVQGHPRLRLGVNASGTPSIVMLSKEGKTVYRAGQ